MSVEAASAALLRAKALLICAGAGMGVDSGLPDFRGDAGFWKAYPPFGKLGLSFIELANPRWFRTDPALAWGFYGHRRNMYRRTQPHDGFAILKRWAARMPRGAFVFTSNVDGHFQKAGFDDERIYEVHGAVNFMQCTRRCGDIWEADWGDLPIDEATMRAHEPLPRCRHCDALARPNVLMFGDGDWQSERSDAQESRFRAWLATLERSFDELLIVECGAGTAVPTVRMLGDRFARAGAGLIRINVREPDVVARGISIGRGALEALREIDALASAAQGAA
jgi:NAD-dependent SIR2 family protein deacetylase